MRLQVTTKNRESLSWAKSTNYTKIVLFLFKKDRMFVCLNTSCFIRFDRQQNTEERRSEKVIALTQIVVNRF